MPTATRRHAGLHSPRAAWAPLATLLLLAAPFASLSTLATLTPRALGAQGAATPPRDTSAADSTKKCKRCLSGHRFLSSSLVPDPFPNTRFRNGTGGGAATNLNIKVKNLKGEVIDSVAADIGLFLVDFDYQYQVVDWLGLRATASITGRVGTSGAAVLASGVSALSGRSLGATARVWQNQSAIVSLTADFRRNETFTIDPYHFAAALDSGQSIQQAKTILLRDQTTNRWSGGVRGAWAPEPWLGLNALFELGSSKNPAPGAGNESVNEVGVLAGFDAKPLWNVPVGVWLGFRNQSGPGRVADIAGSTRTTGLGILYTGRPHYQVGVDVSTGKADVGAGSGVPKLDLFAGRIITHFDF